MKKQFGPRPWLYPMPTPLVAAADGDDTSVCTVAWIGIGTGTPATIAMAMRATRNTLRIIEKTGEFTVNVPSVGQEAIVDFCGIVSSRQTDKFAVAGLTPVRGDVVGAPIIEECRFNIEAKVTAIHPAGEYRLVLGEIVETHADEEILDDEGSGVDVGKLDPLVYIPGAREYRGLTAKVADAYNVGVPLKGTL